MDLGQERAALEDWSLALADDPENPRAYLGRARALMRLRRWDRALVDLEQAADWAFDNPRLLARITLNYTVCLFARPGRFSRLLVHATRTWRACTPATFNPQKDAANKW
jgi:hypothetical protein